MAMLQNVQELKDWQQYRTFQKERLKTLAPEGEPFFVSREDVDFDLKGKPWSGRAFLVGRKGEMAMKRMKKEGVLFRQGTCRVEGKRLHVEGLPAAFVKRAQKTCRKLVLGYEIVGAGAEGSDPEEEEMPLTSAEGAADRRGAEEEEEALQMDESETPPSKAGARGAGAIPADQEEEEEELPAKSSADRGQERRKRALQRELGELAGRIREAAAAEPGKRTELQRLVQALRVLLEKGGLGAAERALERLRALIQSITAAGASAAAGGSASGRSEQDASSDRAGRDASSSPEAREYRRRSRDLFARLSASIGDGEDPQRVRTIRTAAHRAEEAREAARAGRYDEANAALEDVRKVVVHLERTQGAQRTSRAQKRAAG